jgi:ABC-2 type transport system permease protein
MSGARTQWSAFWVLVRARIAETARERAAVAFLFGFPAILLVSLALVFAEGHPYERRAIALDCANGAVATALSRESHAITLYPMSARDGLRALSDARAELLICCPTGGASVEISHGPRGVLTAEAVQRRLDRAGVRTTTRLVAIPRGAYARGLLPGAIAFGALFAGLYGLGLPMLRLRRRRVLARFSLTPLRPVTLVLSQLSARAALTVGQSLVILAVSAPLFRWVPSGFAALAVAGVVLLGVLAFAGIGFLLATIVSNEETHGDLLAASATPLVLLSGAFFPVQEMPRWLGAAARGLPSTALVDGCRAALDPTLASLAGPLGILILWAVATIGLALRRFEMHSP